MGFEQKIRSASRRNRGVALDPGDVKEALALLDAVGDIGDEREEGEQVPISVPLDDGEKPYYIEDIPRHRVKSFHVLHQHVFGASSLLTPKQSANELRQSGACLWAIDREYNYPMAFVIGKHRGDAIYINMFGVHPRWRRKGVMSDLFDSYFRNVTHGGNSFNRVIVRLEETEAETIAFLKDRGFLAVSMDEGCIIYFEWVADTKYRTKWNKLPDSQKS